MKWNSRISTVFLYIVNIFIAKKIQHFKWKILLFLFLSLFLCIWRRMTSQQRPINKNKTFKLQFFSVHKLFRIRKFIARLINVYTKYKKWWGNRGRMMFLFFLAAAVVWHEKWCFWGVALTNSELFKTEMKSLLNYWSLSSNVSGTFSVISK